MLVFGPLAAAADTRIDLPEGNLAPVFATSTHEFEADGTSDITRVVLSVDADTADGAAVGNPITATDPDGERVAYYTASVTWDGRTGEDPALHCGADSAWFDVDVWTGQITVNWVSEWSLGDKRYIRGEWNFCIQAFDVDSDGYAVGGYSFQKVTVYSQGVPFYPRDQ